MRDTLGRLHELRMIGTLDRFVGSMALMLASSTSSSRSTLLRTRLTLAGSNRPSCSIHSRSVLATELSRGRIRAEILLVLGVSLGASAVYSVVEIVDLTTRKTSLSHQSAALNTSLSSRPTFDLIYQFLGLFFDVVPVALVAFLLWQAARPHLGRLGLDLRHPWRDLGVGVLLALVIGAGGIGVYLGGRALGVTVNVSADGLGSYWWTVPILLLSALRAAWPALRSPANARRRTALTAAQFRYGFANAVGASESQALFDEYAAPAPGRPIFQAAAANLDPWTEARVDTRAAHRGPMLIVAGERDHTVPPAVARAAFERQKSNRQAVSEYMLAPGRGHSLTIDSGAREIAESALGFIQRFV